MPTSLSYDDILLYPQQGVVSSRSEVDISAEIAGYKLRMPILSAPMETVTDWNMAIQMHNRGVLGVIHRFCDPVDLYSMVETNQVNGIRPVAVAVGNDNSPENLYYLRHADIIVLDVAHADTKAMLRYVERLKASYPDKTLVAGSVATYNGARRLINAGADILRVGIGAGAACTTRTVTGYGVPMVTSIQECASVAQSYRKKIIADGGIKNTGDIVKALAVGADYVMMGRMFAGVKESPNGTSYFGQASSLSSATTGRYIEGASGQVPPVGTLSEVLDQIEDALRSAVSYGGGRNIEEMRLRAVIQQVTPLTMTENGVRI